MFTKVLLCYAIGCNVLSFLLFGIDKYRAVKKKWRISERTLLIIALIGGSLGALFGMFSFHHKTQKYKFSIGIPLILILHIFLLWLFMK